MLYVPSLFTSDLTMLELRQLTMINVTPSDRRCRLRRRYPAALRRQVLRITATDPVHALRSYPSLICDAVTPL